MAPTRIKNQKKKSGKQNKKTPGGKIRYRPQARLNVFVRGRKAVYYPRLKKGAWQGIYCRIAFVRKVLHTEM